MSRPQAVYVGIDAGTTGVTVALFDERGRKRASAERDYPCLYEHPGWVEQDMEAVWGALCEASREALAVAQLPAAAIRSVGFSSQRGTFVLLDDARRPLAPAIVWNDARAGEMEAAIAERIDRERFRTITGMPLSASWAVAKLAWLGRHRPALLDAARWICNGQEYFLARLGAELLEGDPASLTLNGMLDIRRLNWSGEVCEAVGIDPAKLPPVGAPGRRVGSVSAAAAAATGLPAGTPLCRGAGDQQCAAVGAGVVRQGMAEITIGTSAMMVAHLDHPDLARGEKAYIGGHAVPGKWDLEGGAFAIGACLSWWRDQFGSVEREAAARLGVSEYELLTLQAERSPAGSKGLLFHPFFAGQVTPYYDVSARGGFLGLTLAHARSDLIRSVLEGCGCEMRLMVEAFDADLVSGVQDLRLTGGGAGSPLFAQIVCDVVGRPVGLPQERECTALGAAMLGAVGTGDVASIDEATARMVTIERTLEPTAANRSVYDETYALFVAAYEELSRGGVYDALRTHQERHG